MEHDWLDSLSEDWVSQPPSVSSVAQLPSLPMLKMRDSSPSRAPAPSRIPRRMRGPAAKLPTPSLSSAHATDLSILSILGERSQNDINIDQQRLVSQWAWGEKAMRNRAPSQPLSDCSNGSVVRHSRGSRTPSFENRVGTPEWKRRLLYGDVQYGEHVDLFSSAATGLQDMFRPPEPLENREPRIEGANDDTISLPSSPPIPRDDRPIDPDLAEMLNLQDESDLTQQATPSPSPRRRQRQFKYNLNFDDSVGASLFGEGSLRPPSLANLSHDLSFRHSSSLSIPLGSITFSSREPSGSRKPSADTRNELFSPILLGRHDDDDDDDGQVDFAPLEMPADELHQRLERLRLSQILVSGNLDPEAHLDPPPDDPIFKPGAFNYSHTGAIFNIGAGGARAALSQGSSTRKSTSLNAEVEFSELLPEESSVQASTPKQFPTVRSERPNALRSDDSLKEPQCPAAPAPSPEKKATSGPAAGQSASSPLKLFGPYDTFTNQTLLRRISQFEEEMSLQTSTGSSVQEDPGDIDDDFPPREPLPQSQTINHFGVGDLEGYEFSGDLSNVAHDESGFAARDSTTPKSPLTPGITIGHLPYLPPDESNLQVRRRRQRSTTSSSLSQPDPTDERYEEARAQRHASEKRPRTTPSKDPTPKRRRTLHKSDVAFGNEIRLSGVDSAYRQVEMINAKSGRDLLRVPLPLADVQGLKRKPVFRNRGTLPGQASLSLRQEQQSPPERFRADGHGLRKAKSPSKASQLEDEGSPPDSPTETSRKPSIKTQDFVDQAAQIMAMIRNQVSQPGLTSLVESESEVGQAGPTEKGADASSEASTDEPLSRPPSREGKFSSWFGRRQADPELVNRLKKYQELSDMGDVISSSVRSMSLAKDAIRAAREVERMIERSSRGSSGSSSTKGDRALSGTSSLQNSATSSSFHDRASADGEHQSHSAGRSTSHTFPSSSSRSSESRRIIMPESVSHLIPDNIGSMYLDKQNNIWIKKKEPGESASEVVACDESEEDPFASIPDLTVDMTKELQQLKSRSRIGDFPGEDEPRGEASSGSPSLAQFHEDCTDQARNLGMAARAVGELRKLGPTASGPATAVGDEAKQHSGMRKARSCNPRPPSHRRNLTISFSSPIASIIQDMLPEDLDSLDDDPIDSDTQGFTAVSTPSPPPRAPAPPFSGVRKMSQLPLRAKKPAKSGGGGAARRSFIPRPVSRIDEQDEEGSTLELTAETGQDRQLSIIQDKSLVSQNSQHENGLTFLLHRTPPREGRSLALQGEDSLLIGQNIGRLSLTPLSEFTLNHQDQSFGFEVSYVMGRQHMATGNGTKKVLSMTIRRLVEKLAEVEPYEPYWEDMTQLDLRDKQLTSLHMLDEFCGKVTVLDASENSLAHLEGVPSRVRQLKVSHNMLTELTSWDHLGNLQYVDISGNEVKSLSALRGLVHLRSLRADQNRLTSLEGLDAHDGLLSLRARHNLIEELDLREMRLERLTDLDLEGNCIRTVHGLEALPALAQVNLSGNRLQCLAFETTVRPLRQLLVNDNDLVSLDIRNLPDLQTLHIDRNRLQELSGFRHVRRIDSLSVREQRTDVALDLGFLDSAYEVRKLFLSGNFLQCFEPRADFLNLQLLELANCGLQGLPSALGQMMPNLRALNLNFNAISDLTPLRFIPRLKKLYVAGNRLADSTLVTELLTDFPHLTQLDLRDNPITQGFYPPLRMAVDGDKANAGDPFTLTGLDPERDAWFFRLLDEPTKLRRRLHEVVFVASCKRLRRLDGLAIERSDVLSRDPLLQLLIDEGLVPELEDTLVADSGSGPRIRETSPE